MRYLVTGGYGFIGSNFINLILKNSENKVINIDNMGYAADSRNLKHHENNPNYIFRKVDISILEQVEKIFDEFDIDVVIHFAAESHVDNSINSPSPFIYTNIVGTFNILECIRNKWGENSNKRMIHVSTDEVYGSLNENDDSFTENSKYLPNSPYSASKAASDLLVRSYIKTYNLNIITTNCSNNFGPNQHDEKLIPTIIRNIINKKEIPIYGNGQNVRDWLFVEEHCKAIEYIRENGTKGETYLIGTENELSNLELTNIICDKMNKLLPSHIDYKDLITFVEDRKGHDNRYSINPEKLEKLGFSAKNDFDSSLQLTLEFYINKYAEV